MIKLFLSLILGKDDGGRRVHASDFANSYVVTRALSHALAGPSELRAGALHAPPTEDTTRRSCNDFPGKAAAPITAVARSPGVVTRGVV